MNPQHKTHRDFLPFTYVTIFLAIAFYSVSAESEPGIVAGRDTKGLTINLVSELETIKAGEPFLVGLKIQHDPKFHTYWQNPGIVGLVTTIQWQLPEGFTASPISWPYPEKSLMAGYPCFGYKRDVLLTVKITPPAKLEQSKVDLVAATEWMCCSSRCYHGLKTFTLTLPTADQSTKNKTITAEFAAAEKSLPRATKSITAKLLSAPDAQQIRVQIKSDAAIKPINIFNSDKQTTPDQPHQLTLEQDGSWIFRAKRSEFGPQSATQFPFILQTDQQQFHSVVATQ